jgi:hypothetical protein
MPEQTGVRISRVLGGASADPALQVDDVLCAVDGIPVACDGTVALREHDRVHFEHLVSLHQVGDSVRLDISRAGTPLGLDVTLRPYVAMVLPPQPDRRPSYFIFAGLVFMTLTYEYMAEWEWARKHHRFNNYKLEVFPTPERKEVVLIAQVLAHQINLGYHQVSGAVVEKINGVVITELGDVLRAIEAPIGKFHVIETDYHGPRSEQSDYHSAYGTRIVLEAAAVAASTAEILAQHGISADRSGDLV